MSTPSSRRQPKSQRRASRRAGAERRERQRRMMLMGGGALALALIAVIVLIALNQDDAQAPESTVSYDEMETDGTAIGDPNAPVDFVVYSDFQCPFCKQFDDQDLPQIIDSFVESGDVRIQWRPMPVISMAANVPADSEENESMQSSEAAMCAADQGEFWPYSEALFAAQGAENSGVYSTEMLKETAAELGLDIGTFDACLDPGEKEEEILAIREDATERGVSGTPTFLINDQLISYTREGFDRLEEQINQALDGELADS